MTQNTNITALEDTPILIARYQRSAKEYYIKTDFIFQYGSASGVINKL